MAVDKLVDSTQLDADLTSVANAIRIKGGTSGQMAFPAGFVSAVQAIPTGITPTGTKQIAIAANGTTTEDVTNYASAEITVNVQGGGGTSVNDVLSDMAKKELTGDIVLDSSVTGFPHANFMAEQPITSFRADGITGLTGYAFQNCTSLTTIHFPNLVTLYAVCCFMGCSNLKMACFPKLGTANLTRYLYSQTFRDCISLEVADLSMLGLGETSRGLNTMEFMNCQSLEVLILRKTDGVCYLGNINAFQGSTFDSTGTGGTLYVPSSLVSQYTQATNWSTILGYANNQIKAIEGSIYETQYADGTPIT